MGTFALSWFALTMSAAAALLAGCGALQPSSSVSFQPTRDFSAYGTGKHTYKVLYNFKGSPDGSEPLAGLVALSGSLYGTTYGGGGYHSPGTIFRITTNGKEGVLFRFSYGSSQSGFHPTSGLLALNGMLYGAAPGGNTGSGVIYRIAPSGQLSFVYDFKGKPDGSGPSGPVTAVGGALYGVTLRGGKGRPPGPRCRPRKYGCGTLYEVTASGAERVVNSFNKMPRDGEFPGGNLVAANGTLYGTTYNGGDLNACPGDGCGTVFSVGKSGRERVLYRFKGPPDAESPNSLVVFNKTLYGTAAGGSNGLGTIFSVSLSGEETILYSFPGGANGASPSAGLTIVNGLLYGTTQYGGTDEGYCPGGCGTVFILSPSGAERVLYRFRGYPTDGSTPVGDLTLVNGKLYGATSTGGSIGAGTVFRISP